MQTRGVESDTVRVPEGHTRRRRSSAAPPAPQAVPAGLTGEPDIVDDGRGGGGPGEHTKGSGGAGGAAGKDSNGPQFGRRRRRGRRRRVSSDSSSDSDAHDSDKEKWQKGLGATWVMGDEDGAAANDEQPGADDDDGEVRPRVDPKVRLRRNRQELTETVKHLVEEATNAVKPDGPDEEEDAVFSLVAMGATTAVLGSIVWTFADETREVIGWQLNSLRGFVDFPVSVTLLVSDTFRLFVLIGLLVFTACYVVWSRNRDAILARANAAIFGPWRTSLTSAVVKRFVLQDMQSGAFAAVSYVVTMVAFERFMGYGAPLQVLWSIMNGIFFIQGALFYRGHRLGIVDEDKALWRWARHCAFWHVNGAYRLHSSFINLAALSDVPQSFVAGQVVVMWHPVPTLLLGALAVVPAMTLAEVMGDYVARRPHTPAPLYLQCVVTIFVHGFFSLWSMRVAENLAGLLVADMPEYEVTLTWSIVYLVLLLLLPTALMAFLALDSANIAARATGLAQIQWREVQGLAFRSVGDTFELIDDWMKVLGTGIGSGAIQSGDSPTDQDEQLVSVSERVSNYLERVQDGDVDLVEAHGQIRLLLETADFVYSSMFADDMVEEPLQLSGCVGMQFKVNATKDARVPELRVQIQSVPSMAGLSAVEQLLPWKQESPVTVAELVHSGSTIRKYDDVATLGLEGRVCDAATDTLLKVVKLGFSLLQNDNAKKNQTAVPGLRVVAHIDRRKAPNLFEDTSLSAGNPLQQRPSLLRRVLSAVDGLIRPHAPDIPIVLLEAVDGRVSVLGKLTGGDEHTSTVMALLDQIGTATSDYLRTRITDGGHEISRRQRIKANFEQVAKQQKNLKRHIAHISDPEADGFYIVREIWESLLTIKWMLDALRECTDTPDSKDVARKIVHLVLDCLVGYTTILINVTLSRLTSKSAGSNIYLSLAPLVCILVLRQYIVKIALEQGGSDDGADASDGESASGDAGGDNPGSATGQLGIQPAPGDAQPTQRTGSGQDSGGSAPAAGGGGGGASATPRPTPRRLARDERLDAVLSNVHSGPRGPRGSPRPPRPPPAARPTAPTPRPAARGRGGRTNPRGAPRGVPRGMPSARGAPRASPAAAPPRGVGLPGLSTPAGQPGPFQLPGLGAARPLRRTPRGPVS